MFVPLISAQLTNSYYTYNVGGKLGNAKEVLVAMGYRPKATDSKVIQELEYEGEVDREKILMVGTDLIVLYSELDLVKELVDQLNRGRSGTPQLDAVTLEDILVARSKDEEKYDNLYRYFVRSTFQNIHHRQQLLPGHPSPHYLRQSSERLQSQQEVVVDAWRRVSAPDHQIRATLAPVGRADWLRRTSTPHDEIQSTIGYSGYPVPSPHHHPSVDRVGGDHRHRMHYGNIPGPSKPRALNQGLWVHPQDPSHGLHSAPPYPQGRERERSPNDSGQTATGHGTDHQKIKQSAPIHELLHDKNIYQKAPPTDPPLGQQPLRAPDGVSSCDVMERHQIQYGGEPPQSNPMGGDFLQRNVEESLPKGRTPASVLYANASETVYGAGNVRSQPAAAHHYHNIEGLLRLDDGEEVPLPTSSASENQRPQQARQRANTADRDRKVEDLYAQYPELVNSARRSRGHSAILDSLMYGDVEDNSGRQELETTYEEEEEEQGSDLSSLDLPEPVARTKQDLERLGAMEPSDSSSSFFSMNPEIKDVHSVYDDDFYRGPELSLVPRPLGRGVVSPELEQGGSTAEKWKVSTTTELSGPSSLEFDTEKSPSSSLEQQKSLGSDDLYGGPSCEEDKRSDVTQEPRTTNRGALHPSGKPPPSPHSESEKPKPRPRQKLGPRSNTLDEPEPERVQLPSKSNSASKLVEFTRQAGETTAEPQQSDINPTPTVEPRLSPVPSPRRLKPRTASPRLEQSQPHKAEKPASAGDRGHSVPTNTETQHERKTPLNLPFGKRSTSQDLKSPPTVGNSKVSASMPDKVGQTDKCKPVLGQGYVHIDTPGSGPSSFENKFWVCDFCTNLVLAPSPKCDICGTATRKSTHKQS